MVDSYLTFYLWSTVKVHCQCDDFCVLVRLLTWDSLVQKNLRLGQKIGCDLVCNIASQRAAVPLASNVSPHATFGIWSAMLDH